MTASNMLYFIIGALLLTTVGLSYQLYQSERQPQGVQINLGPAGLSIEEK